MNTKWLAVILMWVAGAGAIVGTAAAWGLEGRGTTLMLGTVLSIVLLASTGFVAQTDRPDGKLSNG
jgi:hypothetical protein